MAINLNTIIQTSFQGYSGYSGALPSWKLINSNYTATDTDRIIADTTAGSFTITLPLNPSIGSYITIADANDWEQNNLIIARNGSTIEGLSDDLLVTIQGMTVELIYTGTTWQVVSNVGVEGPSTAINATDDSTPTQLYPVMVATGGSNQTPTITTNKLSFNAVTGKLTVEDLEVNIHQTLDDISWLFNGVTSVFPLTINKVPVTTIVDSSDIEVTINGIKWSPYVKEIRYPWFTPYDSYKGYRVVGSNLIIYNPPATGDSAIISIINRSAESQVKKYPYSASSIALGD